MTDLGYATDPPPYVDPSIPYFTGTAGTATADSPWIWPVAINGRGYLVDLKSGEFRRAFEPRLRDSQDAGAQPGGGSVSMSGLWPRSIDSWHHGQGQPRFDEPASDPARYSYGRRVDPWVRGEIGLLHDVELVESSTGAQYLATVGDAVYYATGASLTRYNPVATALTALPSNVVSMTTDGLRVWMATAANGVYYLTHPATVPAVWNALGVTVLGYARGRLLGAAAGAIYDLTAGPPAAPPTALFTAPEGANFTWVGFAEGPTFIYAAGYIGNRSRIYRIGIKADGTGLDAPVLAATLPDGEVVTTIYVYGGLAWIGTRTGVRMAQLAAEGLQVGALVPMGGPVRQFEGEGQYVWATNSGITGEPDIGAGLMRFDPTSISDALIPAYANDLELLSTSLVTAVASLTPTNALVNPLTNTIGTRYFTLEGVGLYREAASLVSEGYWEWGRLSYGLPAEDKIAYNIDALGQPVAGNVAVTVYIADEDGVFQVTSTWGMEKAKTTFSAKQLQANVFRVRMVMQSLNKATDTLIRFVQMRAYPSLRRGRLFQVPILLHQRVAWVYSEDRTFDVRDEVRHLEDLVNAPKEVLYQDMGNTYRVVVEDVEWVPHHGQGDEQWDPYWNGTALVTMKELAA